MTLGRLSGKIVAITGAASGVGRAVAQACADAGAKLALLDVNVEAVGRVSGEIGDRIGEDQLLPVGVDITDPHSVHQAFEAIMSHFGALHGLFNNAGVATVNQSGRIEDVSDEAWSKMIAINLTGCFLCCRSAMGPIESSGGGSIVNNASTAALVAEPGLDAYAAAKGGVVALSRALAASSAARNVRVNSICPGLVRTPMSTGIGNGPVAKLEAETLLSVPGPEALGGLLVYLLSDESSYMTGSTVVIDGGLTAH